ncbi:MAG: hypothetical protein IAE79_07285 [Anaerolinea sp.]|nr:hypothetical protein [Anaerolinea sp.]
MNKQNEPKQKRGRKRKFFEPVRRTSAHLPEEMYTSIVSLGNGNFSRGVRILHEHHALSMTKAET